ncbi:MAG: hypothetical protein ACKO2P_20005 [Planctomycetota bacterium]
MKNYDADLEDVMLSLARTRLDVLQSILRRRNEDDSTLFRMPLSAVLSAEFRRPIDPRSILVAGVGLGLIGIAHFVSTHNVVTCLLDIIGLLTVLMPLLGLRRDQLILKTTDTEMVIDCAENPNEVRCFIIALNILLTSGRDTAAEDLRHSEKSSLPHPGERRRWRRSKER